MDAGLTLDPREETSSSGSGRLHIWTKYKVWAEQNQNVLYLLDDALSRVIFWTPNNNSSNSRWRDMAWGILELHRLFLDHTVSGNRQRSPVASIESQEDGDTEQTLQVQWALTVLQTVYPVLHQLVAGSNDETARQRQNSVRKYIETLRFLLRALLLLRYWKGLGDGGCSSVPPGLLVQGGRMTAAGMSNSSWTLEKERQRVEQCNYVGSRTGKRWSATTRSPVPTGWLTRRRIQLGEMLYILRPLVQSFSPRLLLPLTLDCAALACTAQSSNPATRAEWRRRRMRLWLYLLRSPLWDRYTERAVSAVSRRVEGNILGRLATNYLWEWLYYWKEYRIEEG